MEEGMSWGKGEIGSRVCLSSSGVVRVGRREAAGVGCVEGDVEHGEGYQEGAL